MAEGNNGTEFQDSGTHSRPRTSSQDRTPFKAAISFLCVASIAIALGFPRASRAAKPDALPRSTADQNIRVRVRGAVAEITVTRILRTCDGTPWEQLQGRRECVLDIALPEDAALLDVQVLADGGALKPVVHDTKDAREKAPGRYLESLKSAGFEATPVAFNDEATYRLRVFQQRVPAGDHANHRNVGVQYSFVAPLSFEGSTSFVAFPPAPELSPPEARVDVQIDAASGIDNVTLAGEAISLRAGQSQVMGQASTRQRWRIALAKKQKLPAAQATIVPYATLSTAPGSSGASHAAIGIGVLPGATTSLPDRVLFVIDRSKSVGPGGLEAERDAAALLLRSLPPSTKFDAVLFDRTPKRLFPIARQATRQAMAALADEMVPARLSNGTDLVSALQFAGDLLRRESTDFAPRALLVVLTDGAVGVPATGTDPWPRVLSRTTNVGTRPDLMTLVLAVRSNDDPSVSIEERQRLKILAAQGDLGGVENALSVGDLNPEMENALASLRMGGSVFGFSLPAGIPTSVTHIADSVEPGRGARRTLTLGTSATSNRDKQAGPRSAATRVQFQYRAQTMSLPLHPVFVPEKLLAPLDSHGSVEPPMRTLITPGLTVLWEPAPRAVSNAPVAASGEGLPKGFMERSVVRDALSIAYTPRARACYLNRTARTPADRDLTGKVRLALDMVRGEVGAARVVSTTLAHPAIEACLRDAAFALDIPRAYRNDEPVTAILNLVFRPRTPERKPSSEKTSFDRELELVIEASRGDAGTDEGRDAGTDVRTTRNPDARPAPSGH